MTHCICDLIMKYIDEYRDTDLIKKMAEAIRRNSIRDYLFMEVCGGHTAAIHRFGIPSLLPQNIRLISGPGCPVCVTATDFIDKTIAYSKTEKVIITTFGDLIRIPGSSSSLEKEKAAGRDVRIVFSGLEALEIARNNPENQIIFPGIGFETTAPGTAVTVRQAEKEGIGNFFILSAHKLMPPAMEAIIKEGVRIDGFICPGHVATITGSEYFRFIPDKYNLGCVISGFEPSDIIHSIYMLMNQVNNNKPVVEIQYTRAVKRIGNTLAQGFLADIFEKRDESWRGLGVIKESGLKLRKEFERFDAEIVFPLNTEHQKDNPFCMCGDILRGIRTPRDCPLFGKTCVPENPVGACMVSVEGACNTWFKYVSHE
jgi:hydrogenase expression/formation protein HypD